MGRVPRRGFPPDEEDEDDEDYPVVKEEADEAMEDAAPPCGGDVPPGGGDVPPGGGDVPLGAVDLPSEYQAVVAACYDGEALLQQVLEASKANEDKIFPSYSDAITLMGMVAEHLVSLPPPPPLLSYARPVADYEGQKVPPPPDVLRHQHRHDHPHGVVINPPSQPSGRSSPTSSPTMRSSWRRHNHCP
jgi:hypothetical protein